MGLQKKNSRRNPSGGLVDKVFETKIHPISIDDMVLRFNGMRAYFCRLKYKGFPALIQTSKKNCVISEDAIDMHRDGFVRAMYDVLQGFSTDSQTGYSVFKSLGLYLRALDEHDRPTDLSEENVLWYMTYLESGVRQNLIKKNTYVVRKNTLSMLLLATGNVSLSRKLPSIKNKRASTTPYKTLSDTELTRVGKKLMTSYLSYSRLILSGGDPDICLMFDEQELISQGLNDSQIRKLQHKAKMRASRGQWQNIVTRLAFMIISMWTGGNVSALAKLNRSDVVFRREGNTYEFNSVKARALYQQQELGFGFVKRTKYFIESWLTVSGIINPQNTDAPLFPFLGVDGRLNLDSQLFMRPHEDVNKALAPYGYAHINASIFRKTRSSILMRAFEDVFVVADANKSSVSTVSGHYLYGNNDTHDIQLSGAFTAINDIATGTPKKQAVKRALKAYKDPLSVVDWNALIETGRPSLTPSGTVCCEPHGERAKQSLIPLRNLSPSKGGACVGFMGCINCEYHKTVAHRDCIWQLMSYRDSIIEQLSHANINSQQPETIDDELNSLAALMVKFEETEPEEYRAAVELNKNAPHPLYDDECSIEDLMEVYQ